jgi:hypothetical protein
MSDSFPSTGIVVKQIGMGARCGNAAGKRKTSIRFSLIAAVIPALLMCNAAMAQVGGMASPIPTIGATSPLGMGTGSAISPTGIPFGSTEMASPGVSPAPTDATGTISMSSSGTTCSTLGTAPSGMYGSTSTYDGGGMTTGTGMPASGMSTSSGMSTTSGMLETSGLSGMCGFGSGSIASSSAPTSPVTPGGAARTGLPLGSTEIGNLGVSSATAVPTMTVSPTVGTVGSVPTMPTTTFAPTVSSTTTNLFPCLGAAGTSSTTGGC